MANFRCTVCAGSGEHEYDHLGHARPLCGSPDVVFAVAVEDLPNEVLEALIGIAPPGGETDE